MKYLQHTCETRETLRLQHVYIVIATYATSQIYFCNIQIKHLKHNFETSKYLKHSVESQCSPRGHDLPGGDWSGNGEGGG
jgi:hypothetical protein